MGPVRVWASETQVPQNVRFASLFSASCHPHPSASPRSPRHLLHPALGTTAPESGNVTLTLPACPSGEPIPGAHAPGEGPFPALGTNHPASPSPGQCLPLSLSSPSLGRRHLSAGTHPCLPPRPHLPAFCLSLAPAAPSGCRAPLTKLTAGGQHQRRQCQPYPPHGLVPAACRSWACPPGMGALCSHSTSQPSSLGGSVSQVAEVRRPAPCPGAPPASTWTRSSMALLHPSPPLPHSSPPAVWAPPRTLMTLW